MEVCSIVFFYLQHINLDKMKAKNFIGIFSGLFKMGLERKVWAGKKRLPAVRYHLSIIMFNPMLSIAVAVPVLVML